MASESITTGRSSRECKELDLTQVIKAFYYFAGSNAIYDSCNENYTSLGLVGIVPHYDSPLVSIVSKIAPALATGNTCLIAVSPHMLSAFMLAEVCIQSGVPPGVVNVVASDSDELVSWIATDSRVAAITFDGYLLVFTM